MTTIAISRVQISPDASLGETRQTDCTQRRLLGVARPTRLPPPPRSWSCRRRAAGEAHLPPFRPLLLLPPHSHRLPGLDAATPCAKQNGSESSKATTITSLTSHEHACVLCAWVGALAQHFLILLNNTTADHYREKEFTQLVAEL